MCADIQSKVEGLELLVSQCMTNDANSQLADQFVELSTRLQEIEATDIRLPRP